jgi:hypothetical protein
VSSDQHLRVVTPAKNGGRPNDFGTASGLQPSASPRSTSNLYDDKSDLSNGMYSHELVSAISQITQRRRDDTAAKGMPAPPAAASHRGPIVDRCRFHEAPLLTLLLHWGN